MASPRAEVFTVLDAAGTPVTGATVVFLTYKNTAGVNLAQPAITEIGGGAYMFAPLFADPTKGIVYVADTGAGHLPRYYTRYIRPEDWDLDAVRQFLTGKWTIFTTGPMANQLVCYDDDGLTPLYTFDLRSAYGMPTTLNPYTRDPV